MKEPPRRSRREYRGGLDEQTNAEAHENDHTLPHRHRRAQTIQPGPRPARRRRNGLEKLNGVGPRISASRSSSMGQLQASNFQLDRETEEEPG